MSEDRARGGSGYCAVETQDGTREGAREADMPLSRLVMELARADDPDRHALVLSEAEKRAMRDDLHECAELVQALRRGLPGCGGLTLLDALDLLAEAQRR
ncbi:MAG: hypothetical protein OXB97_13990 [Rhodospirillales bacterium]|nr:hypothetical protein [Rhodospirillales bacterium]